MKRLIKRNPQTSYGEIAVACAATPPLNVHWTQPNTLAVKTIK